MIHVPDVEMPADCLTKWLPSAKLRRSVEYMTGARVAPTANTGQVIEMSAIEGAIAHVSEAGPTAAHGDAGAASGHPHRGNRSGDSVGGSVVGRVPGWGASVTEPTPVTRVVYLTRSRPAQESAALRLHPLVGPTAFGVLITLYSTWWIDLAVAPLGLLRPTARVCLRPTVTA